MTGDFAPIMNAKRLVIEPNRPVDCIVIGRSPVAMLAAGVPVTAMLIRVREAEPDQLLLIRQTCLIRGY